MTHRDCITSLHSPLRSLHLHTPESGNTHSFVGNGLLPTTGISSTISDPYLTTCVFLWMQLLSCECMYVVQSSLRTLYATRLNLTFLTTSKQVYYSTWKWPWGFDLCCLTTDKARVSMLVHPLNRVCCGLLDADTPNVKRCAQQCHTLYRKNRHTQKRRTQKGQPTELIPCGLRLCNEMDCVLSLILFLFTFLSQDLSHQALI